MYDSGDIDNSLSAGDWAKLEEVFSKGRTFEVVKALRLTGNTPLRVSEFTMVQLNRSVIGGMNASLSRQGVGIRLALLYGKKPLRVNEIFFMKVARPTAAAPVRGVPCF